VLGTGRPEGQVPLLAADCVVALTIREGVPISEPLVGGPVGQRHEEEERGGTQWPLERTQNQRVRSDTQLTSG
jgi:hypothetical protein